MERKGGIMSRRTSLIAALALAIITTAARPGQPATTGWTITGWNNLGMHCMDADFSVFAILPPYNTIHAQVVDASGNLVTSATGITVTYQAIADPSGSINTTSVGKDNFWTYAASLFGLTKPLPPDVGLTGVAMPGMMNTPRPMTFDPANDWFIAEGIPITPYDDAGHKNTYPMMRLVAKDSNGNVLATTDIVLPISDEMACSTCHASGGSSAARPLAGWVNDPDPIRDYRLNVLRLHDDRNAGSSAYTAALSNAGYSSTGLYETVVTAGKPVLCATCHGSNALAGTGQAGIPPLTQSIHSYHAQVTDPVTNMTLDSSSNRSACYRCHPGSTTKCLRGAMGSAVASDGSMEMQCQNCHGPMHSVGTTGRQGWLDEPNCQSCHTGTAVSNNGQIRYTSVFDASGQTRIPVNTTFATTPNTPAAGYSLYRFSKGHGGLACSACHGSTHAEFPTSHANDNIQSVELQGHKGMLADCTTCHGSQSLTIGGGPHGMHPVGQGWVSSHGDAADDGRAAQCQACHGTDYRGTVLSRAQGDRTISAFGSKLFWQGFQIGCYTCHNGPGSESASSNPPATVSNASASTTAGTAVTIPLSAKDPNGNTLTLRVVSQPANGTAGLAGTKATYYPDPSFSGTDTFTYAAWNGSTDSNLGTVAVTVAGGAACIVTAQATVPATGTVGQGLAFQGSGTEQGCSTALTYAWSFGDGSSSSQQSPTHVYANANTYTWTLTVSSGSSTNSTSGTVTVTAPACTVTAAAVVPSSTTVGTAIQFRGSGTEQGCSTALAYAWTFGDGSSSSQQSPTHAYANANTYTWRLTVSSGSSTNSTSGTVTVTASACTVTAAAVVPSSAAVGSSIQFQGSGTEQGCSSALAYTWTFGDGSSSTQQSPTHAYASANTYAWKLTVSSGSSSSSTSGTVAVTAPACALFVTGTVATSAYVGQSVSFPLTVKASGCGGTISYRWSFGDGSDGSSRAQPTHTYRSAGTFTWRLNATLGSTSTSATGTIAVAYKPRRRL
jgi:PKD repeat protein